MRSFLGEITDSCFRKSRPAPTTAVLFTYSDPVSLLYRRKMRPSWPDARLICVKARVERVIKITTKTFEIYQCSKMGIQNWTALDCIVVSLTYVGELEYLLAGQFESFAEASKQSYCLTAKRKLSFMHENFAQQTYSHSDSTLWGTEETHNIPGLIKPQRTKVHI